MNGKANLQRIEKLGRGDLNPSLNHHGREPAKASAQTRFKKRKRTKNGVKKYVREAMNDVRSGTKNLLSMESLLLLME